MGTAHLDVEKFAKVQALARDASTTDGERLAALSRLDAIAKAAGMTAMKAAEIVREASEPKPAAYPTSAAEAGDMLRSFFDTPEFRARRDERDRERAIRAAEVLKRYGSAEAAFADTAEEAVLRKAVKPFVKVKRFEGHRYVASLSGWTFGLDSMPAKVRTAVTGAIPMPSTVAEAWAEYQRWDRLSNDRCALEPSFEDWHWNTARILLLEEALNTLPAVAAADMLARLDWMQHLHDRQSSWTHDLDPVRFATMRADVLRLWGEGQGSAPSADPSKAVHTADAHSAPKGYARDADPSQGRADGARALGGAPLTLTERRTLAASILDDYAALSDREIARRAGVSPTTVGKLRKSRP